MDKPVIITCAPTGGIHTPTMSPHLPLSPDQIATASIEAAGAGAAIIHLHARDPATGEPDPASERFMEFLPRIKQASGAVLNISTGGNPAMSRQDRLRAAIRAAPEMASLNMGTMNFGLFPLADRYPHFEHGWEAPFLAGTKEGFFRNTFADIEYILKELGEGHGTRFEFECYDLGHLHNLAWVVDQGWVKPPFFIQIVLGILGGAGADVDNLVFLHNTARKLFGEAFEWSVLGAGRHQMPLATQAALMGGNLRVGLEDSLYIGPGELAVSNAQQVTKIRGIVEGLGRRVASPDEARARLGLKGADRVGF